MMCVNRIQRESAPRRRWMQFSIRTLLIFTSLCAVAAWLGSTWQRAKRQKRVVSLLTEEKNWDGEPRDKVIYDFQMGNRFQQSPPHVPTWLVKTLGVDYFANVVGFESHEIPRKPELDGAALLAMLGDFPQLERLSLFACVPNDRDLTLLRGHNRLRTLEVSFSNVSGIGLHGMGFRDRLRALSLRGCPVTDEGLYVVAGFSRLEELDLSIGNGRIFEPHYSHLGITHLANLDRLKILQLNGLDATDADLAAISKIRSLERLEFSQFPFAAATGAGIRKLAALTELRSLRLHWDLEATIPRGKLQQVLEVIAEAQDTKDWSSFQRAKGGWERLGVEVP